MDDILPSYNVARLQICHLSGLLLNLDDLYSPLPRIKPCHKLAAFCIQRISFSDHAELLQTPGNISGAIRFPSVFNSLF